MRASRVDPSGRVSLRRASSSASTGRARVQFGEGVPQPSLQYHLIVFVAFGVRRVRGDIRAVGHAPAQVEKPSEGRFLNVGFGDGGHWGSQGFTTSTSRPSKSVMLRVATARSLGPGYAGDQGVTQLQ